MFGLVYLIALLVASIPLARTLVSHRGDPPSAELARRVYRDLAYIALTGLAIVAFETTLRIALENYWFAELGQSDRFWFALGLQAAIFAVVLVVGGPLFIAVNWAASPPGVSPACPPARRWSRASPRRRPDWVRRGRGFGSRWPASSALQAVGDRRPGVRRRPVILPLLRLPVYEAVVRLMMTLLVITIVGWAAIGGVSLMRASRRGPTPWAVRRPHLAVVDSAPADTVEAVVSKALAAAAAVWNGWLPQGLVLGALFCRLGCAALRFLGRYSLIVDGHSAVVAGRLLDHFDINVWLPAYAAIIAAWIAAAIVLAAGALSLPARSWVLARSRRWVLGGVFLAIYLAAQIVPSAVERLYVGPNQITLEQPYVQRSITGTRNAYGLQGPDVQEQEFPVSSAPMTRADLEASAPTLRDARIWDWRALAPQLQQTQGLRPYYAFSGVDIDRYRINGAEREVMITARELDVRQAAEAGAGLGGSGPEIHARLRRRRRACERDRPAGRPSPLGARHPGTGGGRPRRRPRRDLLRPADQRPGLRPHHGKGVRLPARRRQCRDHLWRQGRHPAFEPLAQAGGRPSVRRASALPLRLLHPAEPGHDPPQRGRAGPAAGALPHPRSRPLHRRRRRASLRLHPRRLHQLRRTTPTARPIRARSRRSTAATTCGIR